MTVQNMTPIEVDTELARLYEEEVIIQQHILMAEQGLHHAAGHRRANFGQGAWSGTLDDAITKAEHLAETDTTYVGKDALKTLARMAAAENALTDNHNKANVYHAEFNRRGGWTRAFLVANGNGHVHSSMGCSTCNHRGQATRFNWLPEFSGMDEGAIITAAGWRACTTCYPTAPIGTETSLPTTIFSDEDRSAADRKAEREQAKAKRQADKIAKGLTQDGSEFTVSWIDRDAPGTDLVPTPEDPRNREYVRRDRVKNESFKTERAAVQWVVQYKAWKQILGSQQDAADDRAPAYQEVIEAVAAKHNKSIEEVTADIDKKVTAKIKRDQRG